MSPSSDYTHSISIVIPVYLGETTLEELVAELEPYTTSFATPDGSRAVVGEILLVNDNGPDGSDDVIRRIEESVPAARSLWLTRNFGQHAATLAGMSSSGSDWIVTMDEDGQHDPADIPRLLDAALRERAHVVYAAPTNTPPHGLLRVAASRAAKRFISLLFAQKNNNPNDFQSFRLILGEVGRSVAAYAGSGVYLDVALGWVTSRTTTAPVTLRAEKRESSGYSLRSLVGHFWRLVLSSGTRGLRIVSILGIVLALTGVIVAVFFLVQRLLGGDFPQGWTTMVIVTLISSGAVLLSLGVIAEYIGVAVNMAMGKPLYMIMNDPNKGPLGHRPGE